MATFYPVELTGLTPHALHYDDAIGLLVPTERLARGHRPYSAADPDLIERIKEGKRPLGLSPCRITRGRHCPR